MPWIAGLPRLPVPRASQPTRADLAKPIARSFITNLGNPQVDPRDRTYLAQLVTQQIGMPQTDAEKAHR
jgi:hypothetical protein